LQNQNMKTQGNTGSSQDNSCVKIRPQNEIFISPIEITDEYATSLQPKEKRVYNGNSQRKSLLQMARNNELKYMVTTVREQEQERELTFLEERGLNAHLPKTYSTCFKGDIPIMP